MVRAYSSVVEHYVDIVGVASSILATPTIAKKNPATAGFFVALKASAGPAFTPIRQQLAGAYLPCQFGLRFSAKARLPSRASDEVNTGAT